MKGFSKTVPTRLQQMLLGKNPNFSEKTSLLNGQSTNLLSSMCTEVFWSSRGKTKHPFQPTLQTSSHQIAPALPYSIPQCLVLAAVCNHQLWCCGGPRCGGSAADNSAVDLQRWPLDPGVRVFSGFGGQPKMDETFKQYCPFLGSMISNVGIRWLAGIHYWKGTSCWNKLKRWSFPANSPTSELCKG